MPSHPVKNSYGNIFLFYYSIKKNARASVNLTQSTDARAFVLYILCVTIVFSFCSLNEISNKYAKKEYRCHKSGFLMKKRSGMMQLFLPGYTQWRIFVNPPWSINRRRYNHITTNKYSHHHIRCGCHRHLFLGWSIFWMFLCEFGFKQYIFYGAFMHQITSIFDTEFVLQHETARCLHKKYPNGSTRINWTINRLQAVIEASRPYLLFIKHSITNERGQQHA